MDAEADVGVNLRAVVLFLLRIAATVVLAIVTNAVLEESLARGLGLHLGSAAYGRSFGIFALGATVVWAVVLLLYAVSGSLVFTVAATVVLTGLVALANYQKLELRDEPFYPSDLSFATDPRFLSDMVGPKVVVSVAAGVCVLVAGTVLLVRRARRRGPRVDRERHPRLWLGLLGARALVAVLCIGLLGYLAHFNNPGNEARSLYDAQGAYWTEWNQKVNYRANGFIGGLLYNMPTPSMSTPRGYSRAEMDRLVRKYAAVAARTNQQRRPDALDDVNVVLVLSEAYTDPLRYAGISMAQDPMPFTRSLMRSTTSGRMLAQNIGGGTANMEFEVLTGMSMHLFAPQLSSAYQSLVPHYDSFPSAVSYLEADGHDTVAVHAFERGMYRRDEVYNRFGFDRFIYDKKMDYQQKIDNSNRISDESTFRQVRKEIDDARNPLLVNLVTMQNHQPYYGHYDDPVKVKQPRGGASPSLGQYVRGVAHSDDALRSFIEGLKRSDEKTIVVFYGDHAPSAYPKSIYGRNGVRRMHETPFFVWSNYSTVRHAEPTTSPWDFMPLVFQQAGASVPPFYALLDELHAEVPAMDGETLIDGHDRSVRAADLSPRAKQLLRDYRMVQYDLSMGKRYSLEGMYRRPGAGKVAPARQAAASGGG